MTEVRLQGLQVLVLTSGHPVDDSRVFYRQAAGAAANGASVLVVGQSTDTVPNADGVEVATLPPPRSRLGRFAVHPWRCLWAARGSRPDVIHLHDAELLAVVPAIRLRWPRAKIVYDVHEDFAELMMVRDWIPARLRSAVRAVTRFLEGVLVRLVHAVVTVTPPLATAFSGRTVVVAYNFPPQRFAEEAARTLRPVGSRTYDIVHLGTLSDRRARFLLDVLRAVHGVRPSTRSLVIGVHEEIDSLVRSGVPLGCDVVGRIPFTEVADLLTDARLGLDVHPWLTPHLLPALPVKVCEYLLSGCAVVSSTMPVLASLADELRLEADALVLVDSPDPADYVKALLSLLERVAAGDDPGQRLRARAVEGMTWEAEAEKIAELYLSLTGRR